MGELLIKGAKIPKSCGGCPLALYDEKLKENEIICNALLRTRDVDFRASILSADGKYWFLYNRHANCPLAELPPHYGLIERNFSYEEIKEKLFLELNDREMVYKALGVFDKIICKAPIILEANK